MWPWEETEEPPHVTLREDRGRDMFERIHSFTEQELNKLHDKSMEILRDVGVAFHDPEALEIFRSHGIKVDGNIVFIDEGHVEKALEAAPSQFTIMARNPAKSVTIGGKNLVIAPGYGAAFMVTETGEQRKPVMEDYNNFCKLVQTSRYIDMNGCLMVEPSDVPQDLAHLDMIFSNIVLCDKPFIGSSVSRQAARDSLELAGIAWGGKGKIKNKPVMMPVISSLSPLRYSTDMAGALIEYARHGQPVLLGLLMMAGATGPVTLSGLLAVQNAEMLAGITLAELVTASVPVVYGGTSSIVDMRTGALSIGAPELSMIQCAQAQMARFYELPSRGSGGLTDAHFPDMQAGIESSLALATTVMSGNSFILHGCGILGGYIAMSYEKFVADEELCGMLRRMLEPIDISDEAIDINVVKEVGIGGEYLTHPKTLEHCRTEFFIPELMKRQDYESWKTMGRKRLNETATDLVSKRLAAYEKPEIDPQIERDLSHYVVKRKNEQISHGEVPT